MTQLIEHLINPIIQSDSSNRPMWLIHLIKSVDMCSSMDFAHPVSTHCIEVCVIYTQLNIVHMAYNTAVAVSWEGSEAAYAGVKAWY